MESFDGREREATLIVNRNISLTSTRCVSCLHRLQASSTLCTARREFAEILLNGDISAREGRIYQKFARGFQKVAESSRDMSLKVFKLHTVLISHEPVNYSRRYRHYQRTFPFDTWSSAASFRIYCPARYNFDYLVVRCRKVEHECSAVE